MPTPASLPPHEAEHLGLYIEVEEYQPDDKPPSFHNSLFHDDPNAHSIIDPLQGLEESGQEEYTINSIFDVGSDDTDKSCKYVEKIAKTHTKNPESELHSNNTKQQKQDAPDDNAVQIVHPQKMDLTNDVKEPDTMNVKYDDNNIEEKTESEKKPAPCKKWILSGECDRITCGNLFHDKKQKPEHGPKDKTLDIIDKIAMGTKHDSNAMIESVKMSNDVINNGKILDSDQAQHCRQWVLTGQCDRMCGDMIHHRIFKRNNRVCPSVLISRNCRNGGAGVCPWGYHFKKDIPCVRPNCDGISCCRSHNCDPNRWSDYKTMCKIIQQFTNK